MLEKDPATGRWITKCDGCGKADTDPKHTVQISRRVTRWHFDCHAPMGCAECAQTIKDHKGAKGEKLIASLAKAREGRRNG